MHSLTDWKNRFPKIPQRADFWCIPASIENMLRYCGFQALTQEDLILGYCRKFGDDALLKVIWHNPLRLVPAPIKGMNDAAILELAKQCGFRHGNFQTFAEPVEQNTAFQNEKLSLQFIGNISSKADYIAAMTKAVKSDCPILISVNNGNQTFHIQSLLEIGPDDFKAHDLALKRIEEYKLANCVFSNDVLVLTRAT